MSIEQLTILGLVIAAIAAIIAWLQYRKKEPATTRTANHSAMVEGSHNQTAVTNITVMQPTDSTPDLWLAFDLNQSHPDSAQLCVLNKGRQVVFDVTVKFPDDGSIITSNTISRIDADNWPHPTSIQFLQTKVAVGAATLKGKISTEATALPVRITYTNLGGAVSNFDRLELVLPLSKHGDTFRLRKPSA
jgi:hypothetical protein